MSATADRLAMRKAIEGTEVWRVFGFNIDPVIDAILAAPLIPATGEVEWEYAAERVDAYGVVAERRDEMPDDAEELGDWRLVRRRAAGPWVEVTP